MSGDSLRGSSVISRLGSKDSTGRETFDEDPCEPCRRTKKSANPFWVGALFEAYYWYQNWFIVLSLPAAFRAASPLKYSLWSSPMSEPDMFWCLTQAMP